MSKTPTRRRLSRAGRRALILDSAVTVFAACGYDRASMEAIAARAGISKPVIYDHFGSKRELYVAILAEQVGELRDRVLAAAKAAGGKPEEGLRGSAYAALCFARERPDAWRLLFQEPVGDKAIAEAFSEMRRGAREAVAAVILANGLTPPQGIEPELAARAVARMLMAAVESLGDHALEHPSCDLEGLVSIYIDLVWFGARQPDGPGATDRASAPTDPSRSRRS